MNSVNNLAVPAENNDTGGASRSIAYCFEDLAVGMAETFTKTVSEADVVGFAAITGDVNPLHLDEAFAAKTRFKTRIVHGMLYASYISALFATRMPGPGAIYVHQGIDFKAPVFIGETVTARVEVTGLLPDRHSVIFKTECRVGDKLVLAGEATMMVPRRAPSAAAR